MMKINFDKFNNECYRVNNEIRIYTFLNFLKIMYFGEIDDFKITNENYYKFGMFYNNNNFFKRMNKTQKFVNEKMENIYNNPEYFNIYDVKNIATRGINLCNPFNEIYYDCKSFINNFELFTNLHKYNCNNDNTVGILFNISGDDIFCIYNFENEIIFNLGVWDEFNILSGFSNNAIFTSIIDDILIWG